MIPNFKNSISYHDFDSCDFMFLYFDGYLHGSVTSSEILNRLKEVKKALKVLEVEYAELLFASGLVKQYDNQLFNLFKGDF